MDREIVAAAIVLIVLLVPVAMQPQPFMRILPGVPSPINYQITISTPSSNLLVTFDSGSGPVNITGDFVGNTANESVFAGNNYTLTVPTGLTNGSYTWALNGQDMLFSPAGDISLPIQTNVTYAYVDTVDMLYGVINNTWNYISGPPPYHVSSGYVTSVQITGNLTTVYISIPSIVTATAALYIFYVPVGMTIPLATTMMGAPFAYAVHIDGTLYNTPQDAYVDIQNTCTSPGTCTVGFTISVPSSIMQGSSILTFNSWSDSGAATHYVDLVGYMIYLAPLSLTADFDEASVCASLPPIPLIQLEYGCIIPAIVNTYAYVIGAEWLFGIIAAVLSGMLYLKTENTWLVLIVNVVLMPVCAFLLPAQLSGLIYSIFVLAIAGTVYLLVRG